VTMSTWTFGCAAAYAFASGSRAASTHTVKLPDASLPAAGLPPVLAGAISDAVAGLP
jgi:hypothetical protein